MKEKINEIELNGIKYIPKDTVIQEEITGDCKIVILQRGWVYIGFLEKDGDECKLHKAYNIRRWGTSNGLGELVNGKLEDTKLDKCYGVVEFNWLTVINTITVNKEKWENVLL